VRREQRRRRRATRHGGMSTMDDRQIETHRIILQRYDLEELRTLCFDLGVNYYDLPGEGRRAKARELVALLGRQGRLDGLQRHLERDRLRAEGLAGIEIYTPPAYPPRRGQPGAPGPGGVNRFPVGAMGGGGRNYGPTCVFLRTARVLLLTIASRKLDTEMGPKGPPS